MNWTAKNWERLIFLGSGLVFLGFTILYISEEKLSLALALFPMSVVCFFFSNLTRFKKFRGMGFEAELWEEKQEQAESLIERLKDVLNEYTRGVVLGSVMRGRWSDGVDWRSNWALYERLTAQHEVLGQKIDFSDLKNELDAIFIFDLVRPVHNSIRQVVAKGKADAYESVAEATRSGYDPLIQKEVLAKLGKIDEKFPKAFELSKAGNLPALILKWAEDSRDFLHKNFAVAIAFSHKDLEVLNELAKRRARGPLEIDERLLLLSD